MYTIFPKIKRKQNTNIPAYHSNKISCEMIQKLQAMENALYISNPLLGFVPKLNQYMTAATNASNTFNHGLNDTKRISEAVEYLPSSVP
jgi:hypothetical protein